MRLRRTQGDENQGQIEIRFWTVLQIVPLCPALAAEVRFFFSC
jgi:hypothetical protein